MELLYFSVGCILLIVHVFICFAFSKVAKEKGWDKADYFWYCLFGGIMGALLVIALPDKDSYKNDKMTSSYCKKMLDEIQEMKEQLAQIEDSLEQLTEK